MNLLLLMITLHHLLIVPWLILLMLNKLLNLLQLILFLLLAFSIPPNGLIIHIYNTRTF